MAASVSQSPVQHTRSDSRAAEQEIARRETDALTKHGRKPPVGNMAYPYYRPDLCKFAGSGPNSFICRECNPTWPI